jgi:hypothetical protein
MEISASMILKESGFTEMLSKGDPENKMVLLMTKAMGVG